MADAEVRPRHLSIVAVLLIDARGELLMQLRGRFAQVEAGRWTPLGGHVEPGETPEAAVYREVREETTLDLSPPLRLVWKGSRISTELGTSIEARLYLARTTATQDDIECREGEQMLFLPPAVVERLELTDLFGAATRDFLKSPLYREILRGDPFVG